MVLLRTTAIYLSSISFTPDGYLGSTELSLAEPPQPESRAREDESSPREIIGDSDTIMVFEAMVELEAIQTSMLGYIGRLDTIKETVIINIRVIVKLIYNNTLEDGVKSEFEVIKK